MATTPRHGKPYVWISWPTGLLSGERQCHWALWFRSRFKYDKVADENFDLAAWSAAHNALVAHRRAELEADGWTVTVEDQNALKLPGQSAILAGKADLIGVRDGIVLVSDCKTGKQRHADYWQVLLYMLVLGRQRPGVTVRGEVCYADHVIDVHPEELNTERSEQIFALLREVGAEARPARVPSRRECSWCDVPASDCPDRFVETEDAEAMAAAEF